MIILPCLPASIYFSETGMGPSKEDVYIKSQKIDLPPPCPCGHTVNFDKSEVFVPKSVDVRI